MASSSPTGNFWHNCTSLLVDIKGNPRKSCWFGQKLTRRDSLWPIPGANSHTVICQSHLVWPVATYLVQSPPHTCALWQVQMANGDFHLHQPPDHLYLLRQQHHHYHRQRCREHHNRWAAHLSRCCITHLHFRRERCNCCKKWLLPHPVAETDFSGWLNSLSRGKKGLPCDLLSLGEIWNLLNSGSGA